MRREDGGHVDMSLAAEGNSETRLPLVKVSDDRLLCFVRSELMSVGPPNLLRPVTGQCGLRVSRNSPRQGTMRRCSRKQSSRLSHGRLGEKGYQPGSKDPSSIRQA